MFREKSHAMMPAGGGPRIGFLCFVSVCLSARCAWADLEITASREDPAAHNPQVMIQSLVADPGGTTSLRFATGKTIDDNLYPVGAASKNRIAPPGEKKVQERDRDLGQTFLTGARGFTVDAVFLRVGPSDNAVRIGAGAVRVALQFFEVEGAPTLNDNGTPGFLRDAQGHPLFSRKLSPQLDDFLEGETYRPIHVAHGVLPQGLRRDDYLTFKLTGGDQIVLQPNKSYAFMIMFIERGPGQRSLALANRYFGTYTPDPRDPLKGHGNRREGGTGPPRAPFFRPDLPDDIQARLAQQPGTLGFPDVDTFRDLFFAIGAAP